MKKKMVAILVCGMIAVGLIGCGSSSEEAETETEAEPEAETEIETEIETETETAAEFDLGEPVVYERTSEQGDDVIGEYSVLEIPQSEATTEFLSDWYENYVLPSEHDWDIIVYSDRDDYLGVWATDTTMYRDVYLIPDVSNGYLQGDNSSTAVGYEFKDGEVVELWNAAEMGPASGKTPEEVLEEYIDSGNYYPARWDFIDELELLGFSAEEAEAAVESFDWSEFAVEDLQSQSEIAGDEDEAYKILRGDWYTEDEIQYALDKIETE